MHMQKILIVTKQSKVEWESAKFGLSLNQLKEKYSSEGANLPAILASHEGQLQSRTQLKAMLPQAAMISMDKIVDPIQGYDVIVSFGGDNSFTYVTHFVEETPVLGVNSGPGRSAGAMCRFSACNLDQVVEAANREDRSISQWPRLSATIDGVQIMHATSEYFFGEKERKDMSRHVLEFHSNNPVHEGRHRWKGKRFEQKHSGIIIATGAGSTGWFDSACRYLFSCGLKTSPTVPYAQFIISEPFRYNKPEIKPGGYGKLFSPESESDAGIYGTIFPGDELILHSLNDGAGIATADSWSVYDFSRGKKAVIRLSATPLNVVVPR